MGVYKLLRELGYRLMGLIPAIAISHRDTVALVRAAGFKPARDHSPAVLSRLRLSVSPCARIHFQFVRSVYHSGQAVARPAAPAI